MSPDFGRIADTPELGEPSFAGKFSPSLQGSALQRTELVALPHTGNPHQPSGHGHVRLLNSGEPSDAGKLFPFFLTNRHNRVRASA